MKFKLFGARSAPLIDQVVGYPGHEVVAAFRRNSGLSSEQADLLFEDTLRWLWLCRVFEEDCLRPPKGLERLPDELSIFSSIKLLDEMWHQFILCTPVYADFCERVLGRFIHHRPEFSSDRVDREYETLIRYVHFRLGREVSNRWFVEYPALLSVHLSGSGGRA